MSRRTEWTSLIKVIPWRGFYAPCQWLSPLWMIYLWRASSSKELDATYVGVARSSLDKVDILNRGDPVGDVTCLAKNFLHGGWFIHGEHYPQKYLKAMG